jgi:mannose-6-phosphate isomerase-like protein (cupin superfamily)
MKLVLLLATIPLFAADPAPSLLWKAEELKASQKTLESKLKNHTANKRLPDAAGHAVFVVHRDGTGLPEAHDTTAHMVYVISGEAIAVLGGNLVDKKILGPEQISGTSVAGGEEKNVSTGDMIYIPAMAPHWFKVTAGKQITYVMVNLESK